jgi:hypothetical protein
MSSYNVIFEGNISNGYHLQDVKKNLAELLKIDEKKVDILFAKPQVVLKKGLDYDLALKYSTALQKTGAICNVKAVGGPPGKLQMESAAQPDANAQALKQAVPPAIPDPSSLPVSEDSAHFKSEPADETSSQNSPRKGFGDIITGIVIIGIGFTYGGSVFLGNPGPLDYFFDGLGVFWIGRGIYKLVRN